jgi:hypothetical protein
MAVEPDRSAGTKRLLNTLEHTLFKWTRELSQPSFLPSHRHLELYFQQVILTAINKAGHLSRQCQFEGAKECLGSVAQLVGELNHSRKPESLHVSARYQLALAVGMLDRGECNEALERLLEATRILSAEQRLLYRGHVFLLEERLEAREAYCIQRCVRIFFMLSRYFT